MSFELVKTYQFVFIFQYYKPSLTPDTRHRYHDTKYINITTHKIQQYTQTLYKILIIKLWFKYVITKENPPKKLQLKVLLKQNKVQM